MNDMYYPRPDFKRKNWISLNGEWQFDFEEDRNVECDEWVRKSEFSKKIIVPFSYQTEKSGINDVGVHEKVWYKREFSIPEEMKGKRLFLKFGAVDYITRVWLNGRFIGKHEGGYTSFEFEITQFLKQDNILVVEATDSVDVTQPRGKQFWKEKTDRCWYIPTTGIWQNVWIEAIDKVPINEIKIEPDIDRNNIEVTVTVEEYCPGDSLEFKVFYNEKNVKYQKVSMDNKITKLVISFVPEDFIDEIHYWTPENPNLYDVKVKLIREEEVADVVETYFGMRKVEVKDGRFLLNHSPCYLKMVLNQGYWKESGLTAPNDEALKQDLLYIQQMGFNGVRMHQKIEDPRFYYWADRLGIMVWAEMPSAYYFCDKEMINITRDMMDFIRRDFNHPSIIAWVILNESWGVRKILADKNQQNFGVALYHLAKAMDPTRLVSSNDGWENIKSDIVGIHDYAGNGDRFAETYTGEKKQFPDDLFPGSRRLFAHGYGYEGDTNIYIMSEYGGIALFDDTEDDDCWGYDRPAKTKEEFLEKYKNLTKAIKNITEFSGYCYTQLTDVYQEVNGLLDMNHNPKFNLEKIREINS